MISSITPDNISKVQTISDENPSEEKTEFNIILKEVPTSKRINVIKVIRTITSLGLKEAKELIETVPKLVAENISKEKADEYKKILEEAGAIITIN